MWNYNICMIGCNCFVDDYNNLHIFVDDIEVWEESGVGFNEDIVYNTLCELGYL